MRFEQPNHGKSDKSEKELNAELEGCYHAFIVEGPGIWLDHPPSTVKHHNEPVTPVGWLPGAELHADDFIDVEKGEVS